MAMSFIVERDVSSKSFNIGLKDIVFWYIYKYICYKYAEIMQIVWNSDS